MKLDYQDVGAPDSQLLDLSTVQLLNRVRGRKEQFLNDSEIQEIYTEVLSRLDYTERREGDV